MTDPIKKFSSNPLVIAVIALLLGGGAGAGSGLLQRGESAEDTCRALVAAQADFSAKARAAEWAAHRENEDARYATKTEVVSLAGEIRTVREIVTGIRDELRDRRGRRGAPQ